MILNMEYTNIQFKCMLIMVSFIFLSFTKYIIYTLNNYFYDIKYIILIIYLYFQQQRNLNILSTSF